MAALGGCSRMANDVSVVGEGVYFKFCKKSV